jgi:hypothetical protein
VKGRIGLRTEVLKEFGVMPTRSRKRAKTSEDLPSATPGAPGGAPGTAPGVAPPAAHPAETTAPDKPAK